MSEQKSSYFALMALLVVFIVDRIDGESTTIVPPGINSNSIIRAGIEKSEAEVQAGLAILEKTDCAKHDDNEENPKSYPWIALLVYSKNDERIPECGGSLIHERYVLTAAHCIRIRMHTNRRLVSVRLGGYDTDEAQNCTGHGASRKCAAPVQEIDVAEAIYHKDYNPRKFSNDVGIVRLVRNAVIASNVQPICLPITPASRQFDANHMITCGWSLYVNHINGSNITILQEAVVEVKTIEYCQQLFGRLIKNQFCVVGDVCKGDSGGPLFNLSQDGFRYIQHGIFEFGVDPCGPSSIAVYSKVEIYLLWIASNLHSA